MFSTGKVSVYVFGIYNGLMLEFSEPGAVERGNQLECSFRSHDTQRIIRIKFLKKYVSITLPHSNFIFVEEFLLTTWCSRSGVPHWSCDHENHPQVIARTPRQLE